MIFDGDSTSPSAPSRMENVAISFAGGDNGFGGYCCEPNGGDENGALGFFDTLPAPGSISHVSISDSATNGIVEGWTAPAMDLKTGNAFHNVPECEAVPPRPTSGCGGNLGCL